jgi:undecaprenyl-diphosphatase
VKPTSIDVKIANAVSRRSGRRRERTAELLTWGADEHILLGAAACFWLWTRSQSLSTRRAGDHVLATTVASSVLPHLLKSMVSQKRPDRLVILGHLHGVPISGRADDAFPSGHAVHMGAMASAATVLPTRSRNTVWSIAIALSVTRIVMLAHWASDVVIGFATGVLIERTLRPVTGFGGSERRDPP